MTNELYFGVDANKKPVALNRYVDVYDTLSEILALTTNKNEGKIYYAKDKNILCVWNGSAWTQINANTDTYVSSANFVDGGVKEDADGKYVEYTLTIKQADKDGTVDSTKDVTATFKITDDILTSLVVEVAVGLESSVTSNVATIKTKGAGADTNSTVTLKGQDGITLSEDDSGNILIDGTTYTLGSSGKVIDLTGSDNLKKGSVTIDGDTTWIETAGDGSNKIKVSHKSVTQTDTTNTQSIPNTGNDKNKFSSVTDVTRDAAGHVTGIEVTEFTIPNSVYTLKANEATVDTDYKYTTNVQLIDGDGSVQGTAAIKTLHTITVDGEKNYIGNGGDLGTFYSAGEIDNKLKAVNAMVYKGAVATSASLPTSNVEIGQTYMASADFTLTIGGQSVNVEKGDLLIANGTEDANGKITAATLTWNHVPSGLDVDSQYKLLTTNNTLVLQATAGPLSGSNISTITLDDDDVVLLTASGDKVTGNHRKVADATETVNSTVAQTAQTLAYGGKITAVTGIVRDKDYGHVKEVQTTQFTLPGDDKVVVDATTGKFSIQTAANVTKGSQSTGTGNSPLTATYSADTANQNLVVTIDHNAITTSEDTTTIADPTISLGGTNNTFEVVDSVESDGYGHITKWYTKTVTIDKETTYTLESSVKDEKGVITLKDSKGIEDSVALESSTLTFSAKTDTIGIDLVWGSF